MYRVVSVDRFPAKLAENVVYVSEEYDVAALSCACGCGHRVNLLLGDGHTVEDVGGFASIWPSIGVWDAPCRSHFWISEGQVRWAEKWSEEDIRSGMAAQQDRHQSATKSSEPWYRRFVTWLLSLFRLS